jgi:hypothetical protein
MTGYLMFTAALVLWVPWTTWKLIVLESRIDKLMRHQ